MLREEAGEGFNVTISVVGYEHLTNFFFYLTHYWSRFSWEYCNLFLLWWSVEVNSTLNSTSISIFWVAPTGASHSPSPGADRLCCRSHPRQVCWLRYLKLFPWRPLKSTVKALNLGVLHAEQKPREPSKLGSRNSWGYLDRCLDSALLAGLSS